MKKIIIPLIIVIPLITGCVSSHQNISPDVKYIKFPPSNAVTVASLGDRMLKSGRVTTVDGFSLYNDVRVFDGSIMAGDYVQIGVHGNNKVFGRKDGNGTGVVGALSGAPSPAKPYVDDATGYLCFLGAFGTRFCSDSIKPNITKMNMYTPDSFIQELIYTGKVGDKIRFTYREFHNGTARQAFNIDVEYDLSESNIISYRGATIEIILATNRKIEYKLLKHFRSLTAKAESTEKHEPHATGSEIPEKKFADNESISSGSGFFITANGYLLTNYHVVDGAKHLRIKYNRKLYDAYLVAHDKFTDLALLKAEGSFNFLEISNSSAELGEEVFTTGYPNPDVQGPEIKYTDGSISSTAGHQNDARLYQISVPIQPGNSGGPLVTKDGKVTGMIVSKLSDLFTLKTSGSLPQNVNYAIKSTYIQAFLLGVNSLTLHPAEPSDESAIKKAESATAMVLVN